MGNHETPTIRLYLVRHGETVDNVKGLYAGIRDSALTSHGVQQATRLGSAFAKDDIVFTQIFSSNLSRAQKTAEAICNAQSSTSDLSVVPLALLQEQDFGYYEGKPFEAKPRNSSKSGKDAHREQHKLDPGFKDVESKASVETRADEFLDLHLMPLINNGQPPPTIAVVSHGIFLSTLWKCMLKRQAPGSVTIHHELLAEQRPVSLEHIGGWSNTGYLELLLGHDGKAPSTTLLSKQPSLSTDDLVAAVKNTSSLTVVGINKRDHLAGLKRTRGGVGSSAFDEGQKSIESFFKKQKT